MDALFTLLSTGSFQERIRAWFHTQLNYKKISEALLKIDLTLVKFCQKQTKICWQTIPAKRERVLLLFLAIWKGDHCFDIWLFERETTVSMYGYLKGRPLFRYMAIWKRDHCYYIWLFERETNVSMYGYLKGRPLFL